MSADLQVAICDRFATFALGNIDTAPCCGIEFARRPRPQWDDPAVTRAAGLAPGSGTATLAADLRAGESVVDLGCGAGAETLLAARQVGPRGRVWGVDMTEEMLAVARRNAIQSPVDNVAFVRAMIEDMPLPAAGMDAALSNCVLSLLSDKGPALREAARVLKPGGRLIAVEPLAADTVEPDTSVDAWASCLAGALTADAWMGALGDARFTDVVLQPGRRAGGGLAAVISARRPA